MALKFKNSLTNRMIVIINESGILFANHDSREIVFPKDILLAILNDTSEIGCKILEVAGININELIKKVNKLSCNITSQKKILDPKSVIHPLANYILQKADNIATEMGHSFIGTEHVILSFLSYRGKEIHLKKIVTIFEGYGICSEVYKDAITNYYMSSTSDVSYGDDKNKMSNQKDMSENSNEEEKDAKKDSVSENLFLKNINKKVTNSDIKFIGRDAEFERANRILSRKRKNNIILVGKEGTGKTSFVEGLAKKIVDGQVSGKLKNVTILSLDLAGMIAGTKYRGQFEERIKNVIDFLSKKRVNEKYILFIDEIHQILGTGAAEGALDAGSIIKSELTTGNIQCIGATTTKEYKKYILKDGPFSRRMSPIFLEESNIEDTIKILNGIKEEYEDYHNITIDEDVIKEIVILSDRYIPNRNFPDKAIDILDESCTRKYIECSKPLNVEILDGKINKIRKRIDQYKNKNEFDKCKELITQRDELISELNKIKNEHEEKTQVDLDNIKEIILDKDTVRKVISDFSGIPIIDNESEKQKLIEMENRLNNIVINQKEAINKLCKAVFRSKSGLKDPDRPTGVYLFLGETGTGKTLAAKELAKYHFGSKDRFIKIDMSEYMEKYSISKIIGAAPGYIGYDDVGGKLVDKIRTNPYSVILLDEFEKAHPDVFNLFLQVFDEGRLTDSYGETVDLKNTIIIMTSNIGVSKLSKKSMGFDSNPICNKKDKEKILIDELKKIVTPEFFNRIDEVVVFNSLDKESIIQILEIELNHIIKRLDNKNIKIKCTNKAIDFLIEKGFSEKYGARTMKRSLQKYISDNISEKIISEEISTNSSILFDYIEGDNLSLTF